MNPAVKRALRAPKRRQQRGMSLIEILTSVLIFSIGLVGLLGLHARSVQFSASAEDTNRAALLANEMATEMWTKATLSPDDAFVQAWQGRVENTTASGLPHGEGTVAVAGNVATITIEWRANDKADAAANKNRYVTQVVLWQPPT